MSSYNPLGIYTPSVPATRKAAHHPVHVDTRAFAGGRLSRDSNFDLSAQVLTMVAPEPAEDSWRLMNLDSKTLARLTPNKLLEWLCDLSPDLSRALWDFLRMCNPGWKAKAKYPDTDREHKVGQKALDTFLETLKENYGATDIVINRLFFAAFLRGAFFAKLVLDKAGRLPVDLAAPDPCVVRFQKV
jgi:hypothetical protein